MQATTEVAAGRAMISMRQTWLRVGRLAELVALNRQRVATRRPSTERTLVWPASLSLRCTDGGEQ